VNIGRAGLIEVAETVPGVDLTAGGVRDNADVGVLEELVEDTVGSQGLTGRVVIGGITRGGELHQK
jgi:hypothetical protein